MSSIKLIRIQCDIHGNIIGGGEPRRTDHIVAQFVHPNNMLLEAEVVSDEDYYPLPIDNPEEVCHAKK